MKTISKSQVMKMAHAIMGKLNTTFAEALKRAWQALKLQQSLREGRVEFSYLLKDGSVRKAVGTLNPELFTSETKGTGNGRYWRWPITTMCYFDLEKNAFRSFWTYAIV